VRGRSPVGAAAAQRAAAIVAATCVLLAPVTAGAVDRRVESAAAVAIKKSEADFLAMSYGAAIARLSAAARACGASKCTPTTKAAVLRDLGTMELAKGDKAAAAKHFAQALKLQPELTLNPSYDSPELREAWGEARSGGGGPPAEQPQGDFAHTPAAAQKEGLPLPIYVEAPADANVARVVVKYKGAQMNDWARLELKKAGSGWGGMIPCGSVTRGTVVYWVQGFDASGDPVATSGDPKHPYVVPIREEITTEPPHLPGKSAPKGCDEGEEEREAEAGDEGTQGESPPPLEPGAYARVWVGITGALDFLSLPAGNDVCHLNSAGLPGNGASYYCTRPDGTDFPTRSSHAENDSLVPGQAGHVDGGVQPGNVRVMLAADYALSASLLVGARLGYVLNTYTGDAAVNDGRALGPKLHLEARGTYLFGDRPLTHTGFSPMVFVGAGLSEFDGHATSVVSQTTVRGQQPVNIWRTNAPWFAALGGGARYQFSLRAAFTLAARVNAVLGGSGFMLTYGPEVGLQYGF
jgi:hypothetical protein